MIFKGSGCFQFPESVITSTAKESLCSTERGSLQVLTVLKEYKVLSRKCRVENACATETNFCGEGKVMLQLCVVRYQVLLFIDTYNMDVIAIKKL